MFVRVEIGIKRNENTQAIKWVFCFIIIGYF